MADKDKTKDYHRKHNDFMNQYDEYHNEETHRFDMATKQWVKSEEFYKSKVIECFIKADIQCDEILIEEIDECIEILKAQKQPPQV